jgi:hypothetical protein
LKKAGCRNVESAFGSCYFCLFLLIANNLRQLCLLSSEKKKSQPLSISENYFKNQIVLGTQKTAAYSIKNEMV